MRADRHSRQIQAPASRTQLLRKPQPVSDYRDRTSGQALVETLLIGALLSLAAALTLLGARLYAIDHSASQAARAIALECATARLVCPSESAQDERAAAILRRALGEGDRQVLSGDRWPISPDHSALRAFWTGADGMPLISNPEAIRATRTALSFDAGIEVAQAGVHGQSFSGTLLESTGPGRFGFQARDGLTITALALPVTAFWPGRPSGSTGRSLGLSLSARAAILSDAWNASSVAGESSDSVEARVQRGRKLDAAREAVLEAGYVQSRGALQALSAIGLEPLGRHFRPERIDVSIVPADRVPQ